MNGATIVISPPGQPRITCVERLLATPTISVFFQIAAGELDSLDQEAADAYLESGAYIVLAFADARDALELQRRAHAARGAIQ